MADFNMCKKCSSQYDNPADRRFHAQPIACPQCGPQILLTDNKGNPIEQRSDNAIAKTAQMLKVGSIIAIKGIGGFHLAVDATNEAAVKLLRQRKHRDHKPFAMMAASIETIKKHAHVDSESQNLLQSPQAPIVLLPKKDTNNIAPSVATGTNTFGFMLCYAPLHHMIFAEDGIELLVMTSANISDQPLICENDTALEKLGSITDAFLMHNRDIYRQLDDSVMHIIDGEPAFLRRSRGYIPTPIIFNRSKDTEILAVGPDLKNTFCLVKKNQLILSEHIGDLEDGLVYRHYKKSIPHLQNLFEFQPEVVACDLHPRYLSTQHAQSLQAKSIIPIQHHWAHIASVLAEHQYHEPIIGLVADGTGFGTDETIWGCECIIASLQDFQRFGHLAYYQLAGADKSAKEPICPILGLLKYCFENKPIPDDYLALLKKIEPDELKLEIVLSQLEKNVNTIKTSSLGRVFDAVAALLGLGVYNHFEAQLPMALEALTKEDIEEHYEFQIKPDSEGMFLLDIKPMLQQLINDIQKQTAPETISSKFHNTMSHAMLEFALLAAKKTGISTSAVSGGVFCNRYLSNRLIRLLKENGFSVLFNRAVPCNDGGIALGQAAIAAWRLEK